MNCIHSYVLVKSNLISLSHLSQGRYAWLPIKEANYLVIFNVTLTELKYLGKSSGVLMTDFFFSEDGSIESQNLVPYAALQEACNSFNRIIEGGLQENAKYREHFDVFIGRSRREDLSGYNYWLYRSLLYGGLFKK